MKIQKIILVLWILLSGMIGSGRADQLREASLEFGGGYRRDELDWNIAGSTNGTSPNILSELTWENMDIYQILARSEVVVGREDTPFETVFRTSGGFGLITDGDGQDSDYRGDGRTDEFSRSVFDVEGEYVWDVSLGAGLRFLLERVPLKVTPLAGLSVHQQKIQFTDGEQIINMTGSGGLPGPLGPFPGLDSSYCSTWRGPWVGLELEFAPWNRMSLFGMAEYHWTEFEAEARWNLRNDLAQPVSFEHEGNGEGWVLAAGTSILLEGGWSLKLTLEYRDWSVEDGIDRVFFANGGTAVTRLNEVNWESTALGLQTLYRFR